MTELPVGYWTDDFKEHLEKLLDPGNDKEGKKISSVLKDYEDMSKDTTIDFTLVFQKGKLAELEQVKADHDCNGVDKLLKLSTTQSTTNMHLFNAQDKLKKYDKVEQIMDDYFETRLQMYQQRKKAMIQGLEKELVLLSNKARFVQENLAGIVDLRKKKKEEVTALLLARGYAVLDEDSEFNYLKKMPMDSVTEENVAKLLKDCDTKKSELEVIVNTTIHQMWLSELENLREEYMVYKEERERATYGNKCGKMNVTGKIKKVIKK